MSAKDKKSEVSYFEKIECEFLSISHTIYLNTRLLNTFSHLCVRV